MQHVMNFTDVDDRTILESNKAGVPLREYTDRYIAAFREDAAALGLETPEQQPRATDSENITAMAETIVALEKRGHTYRSDGSVYFKISTFPEYGRLARLDHSGIKSGARVDSDKYEKDDARDFVLWKASKPGEPVWDAGFGAGRPGWHIECSAMALRLLGSADRSPCRRHRPDFSASRERDRAERGRDRADVRAFLDARRAPDGRGRAGRTEKMSKSLGNVFNLSDIVEQGYRPSALRYLYLGVHYRKQLKFTWTAMSQAEESLKRLTDFLARLDTLPPGRST